MKLRKILSVLLCMVMLCSCICVNASGGVQVLNPINTADGEEVSEFYDKLLNYIIKYYKYDLTKEELLAAAVDYVLTNNPEMLEDFGKGAFTALDENSMFYNAEEFESRISDVSGVYVGIGINVYQDGNQIILGEALPDSPAEVSGLEVGDIVIAVGGENVKGYALDRVSSLIKGEEGTTVDITVSRNGKEYVYTLKRATIKINPVTYEVLPDTKVGYVKISSFNANSIDEFDKAMISLGNMGIDTVVLDLRNNLGGYMSAAVAVASYFIPNGELIVTEEYKNPDKNIYHYADDTKYKFKGVVLVNEYSASASEVVAGALKDYKAATIVGKVSYGKGTVQIYDIIRSNHYMWYTVAEYYTPSHNTIHKVGIKPDYIVSNKLGEFDMSTVTDYEITRVLKVGDKGEDVYAVKERLKALGYQVVINDVYDENTANAVYNFQKNTSLFPYGVADFTTQIKLNDELKATPVEVDKQLEKAISLAKNMK